VHAIADVDFYSYKVFGYKGYAGICIKVLVLVLVLVNVSLTGD